MIVLNHAQGSPEWHRARLGVPTASMFDRIITPGGAPSTQADAYLYQLLSEWLSGKQADTYENEWMRRGKELEPEARRYYEFARDVEVQQVGFVLLDDRSAGCSPDGLTDTRCVEFKCPAPGTHVQYMLEGRIPPKYVPQVQGQMMICERGEAEWVSYHPDLPPVIVTVKRDDKFIAALGAQIKRFNAQLRGEQDRLVEMGHKSALQEAA